MPALQGRAVYGPKEKDYHAFSREVGRLPQKWRGGFVMRKARCWVVLAVAMLVSSAVLASAPGGKEAKPLPVALGMSAANVEAKLGKPQETASSPDGTAVWTYQEKDARAEISFERGRVARIVQAAVGDDAKEIQGTWKVVSLVEDGSPRTEPETILVIGDGKITPIVDGKAEETGQYRLDSTALPRTIDVLEANSDVGRGVYSLAGDELKICIAGKPGTARPTKLESKPGSDTAMVVLKRQSREWKHPVASESTPKVSPKPESQGPKLVKVSGTVKFNDGSLIPVPEKGKGRPPTIMFAPTAEPAPGQIRKGAGGTIDEKGHFELMTFKPGDGVIPGKYVVTIHANSKYPPEPGSSLVPLKYTRAQTSGLEVTIEKPMSDVQFELEKR
jgi:uncharacterized protein (TIGR03067 family)